jgi:lysophospholipase L1-like esterase
VTERTILCFGDSNTHGTLPMRDLADMRRLGPAERWPGVCAAALGAGWRLIEEGLPGRTAVFSDPIEGEHMNGLTVLPALLYSHCPLDAVVVMLGTNDAKARFGVGGIEIACGIDRLLTCIAGSEAGPGGRAPKALVVCPPPVVETGCLAEMFAGAAAKGEALALPLGVMALARGAAFLNAAEAIAVDPLDGVHFGPEAHAALGRAITDALLRLFGASEASAEPGRGAEGHGAEQRESAREGERHLDRLAVAAEAREEA